MPVLSYLGTRPPLASSRDRSSVFGGTRRHIRTQSEARRMLRCVIRQIALSAHSAVTTYPSTCGAQITPTANNTLRFHRAASLLWAPEHYVIVQSALPPIAAPNPRLGRPQARAPSLPGTTVPAPVPTAASAAQLKLREVIREHSHRLSLPDLNSIDSH